MNLKFKLVNSNEQVDVKIGEISSLEDNNGCCIIHTEDMQAFRVQGDCDSVEKQIKNARPADSTPKPITRRR